MDTTTQDPTATRYSTDSAVARATRIASLDIVRGIIMVLMAIDHVRVYAGVPAGGLPAGVFFTRWVTHFSAPGFAFLAGTGAFLYGQKAGGGGKGKLASYLATRGLVLVLLELTVLRLSWTFNTDFAHYNLAGVLWMLGWCMVLMSGLVWLPTRIVGVVGLLVIFAQGVFGPISAALPSALGKFLYLGEQVRIGDSGPPIDILYVIVPWIGVMAAGYAFGEIMTLDRDRRRRLCLWIGGTATVAFAVIATVLAVAGTSPEDTRPLLFRVLAQQKYPASPLFLMMTLGPIIAFIPLAEQLKGWFAGVMATFGRVPLFFYLLHIPLIHAAACVVSVIRQGSVNPWLFGNHPMEPPPVPPGYRWSLPLLYLVFAIVVALLYAPCKWYSEVKRKSTSAWLRLV